MYSNSKHLRDICLLGCRDSNVESDKMYVNHYVFDNIENIENIEH